MSEWLDGYWTALIHMDRLSDASGHWLSAEWAGAFGSIAGAIGAIIAAAVAAFAARQSNKAAHQSAKVAIEAERASVIQEALAIYHDSVARAEAVAIVARPLMHPAFPHDVPDEKKALYEELNDDWWFFQRSGVKAGEIRRAALDAESMEDLAVLKRQILDLNSEIRDLQHLTENRQRRGWKAGHIPRPGFVGGWE